MSLKKAVNKVCKTMAKNNEPPFPEEFHTVWHTDNPEYPNSETAKRFISYSSTPDEEITNER